MAILNFGSIFKRSLAHPHVAGNVMLKFQKKLNKQFFLVFAPPPKKLKLICGGHFNFHKTLKKSPAHLHIMGNVIVKCEYDLSNRVFAPTKDVTSPTA